MLGKGRERGTGHGRGGGAAPKECAGVQRSAGATGGGERAPLCVAERRGSVGVRVGVHAK